MPTSNSKPQPSAATDSPLGAPAGNEPHKTIRARNWAQDGGGDVAPAGNEPYDTQRMGNNADANVAPEAATPKPAQGA